MRKINRNISTMGAILILVIAMFPAITAANDQFNVNMPEVHIMDDMSSEVVANAKPPWAGGGGKDEEPAPEVVPWGIDRIDVDLAGNTGTGINIAVLDTGIDSDHPDLQANIAGGVAFVNAKGKNTNPWEDDNGHGTHVAGTIGAIDNEEGVIGVAPNVKLWAVKVLDNRGNGYLDDLVDGIDWAVTNNMDVISMSLSTESDYQPLHDAVDDAYAAGVVIVAAAGNDGTSVDYPAAYDTVIAVSATDDQDSVPGWSNHGTEIEISAPGASIYSTYKGGDYKTKSGTSMSAPHVSGTVALILKSTIGNYDTDNDGIWDPVEVRAKLTATAEDLGDSGWDQYYGNGLVDAEAAST